MENMTVYQNWRTSSSRHWQFDVLVKVTHLIGRHKLDDSHKLSYPFHELASKQQLKTNS